MPFDGFRTRQGRSLAQNSARTAPEHSLKFGVIGAGQIGHLACEEILRHPDARVDGRFRTSTPHASSGWPNASASRSATSILKRCSAESVDAVYIATPNVFHAPLALAALKQGKHVLLKSVRDERHRGRASSARRASRAACSRSV